MNETKNALIISDKLQDINKLRRYFDSSFTIKAAHAATGAADLAASSNFVCIVYHIGADYGDLFPFYKELRWRTETSETPLVVIADANVLKPLGEYTSLINTKILPPSATREIFMAELSDLMGLL
ncbi:MAG: hypothetical protein LBN40_05255 [Oscillospiraceae bacterium]|jgi:PleD family two-component response regulator|nr:hypothetical protein [Oscillospiraceae bacterium]